MADPIALNAETGAATFTCNDLEKSVKFYADGLGFEVVRKMEREGKLQFVMLSAGGALVGLGQDDFAKGKDRVKGVAFRMWITTTQDVTAVAARAKAAGLKLDSEPKPLPFGPMAFAITDPDGFGLTIANPIP